jgi:hypothetical protein
MKMDKKEFYIKTILDWVIGNMSDDSDAETGVASSLITTHHVAINPHRFGQAKLDREPYKKIGIIRFSNMYTNELDKQIIKKKRKRKKR